MGQRELHVGERLAELANLVHSVRWRQSLVELPRGDGLCLKSQFLKRFQLFLDDASEDEEHDGEADNQNDDNDVHQPEIAAKDIPLGADDSHAPSRFPQRLVEHVAVLTVNLHLAHTFLAGLHGVSKIGDGRVGLQQGFREDGLVEQFGGVRMYEVRAALSYHDAIGMGIGLDG